MLCRVLKKVSRKNKDIPFYHQLNDITDIKNHINKNFLQSGKLIFSNFYMSSDELTCTFEQLWKERESFVEFCNDEYCLSNFIVPFNKYHEEEGMESITTIEDI